MLGELTTDEIEQVLTTVPIGRIGYHFEGKTYVVPTSFVYDGRRVIAHSGEGQKIQCMRENPSVCFEVEDVRDLANWRSVLVHGRFTELHGSDAAVAIGLLVDRLAPVVSKANFQGLALSGVTPPGRSGSTKESVVFAIEIGEKTGRFERQEEG